MTYNPIRRRLMAGLVWLGTGAPLAARAQAKPCETEVDLGGVIVSAKYLLGGEAATGQLLVPVPASAVTYEDLKPSTYVVKPLAHALRLYGSVVDGAYKVHGLGMRFPTLISPRGTAELVRAKLLVDGKAMPMGTLGVVTGGQEVSVNITELPEAARDKVTKAIVKGAKIDFTAEGAQVSPNGSMRMVFKTPDIRSKLPAAGKVFTKLFDDGRSGACAPVETMCFLTTASVHTAGLADDCWELTTLRAFRDGPLAASESGRALIADYYERAPALVEAVNARADAARVWLATYWTGIVPAAVAAKLGLSGAALHLYRAMVERLERAAAA